MAKQNPSTLKVRILNHPDHPGRGIITGVGTSAKPGDIVELNSWLARHLIQAEIAALATKEVK